MILAPFTPEQVAALNRFQQGGWMHPFTCGHDSCRADLVATESGWECPADGCDYTQDWAHEFMLKPHPLEDLLSRFNEEIVD